MGGNCDWAIIMYNGTKSDIDKTCTDSRIAKHLVHCQRSPATIEQRYIANIHGNDTIKLSVPKTIFYHELLPYVRNYERVFLMDEDISLEGFNITTFMMHWQCSLQPLPLIVQPLVYESNQYINYLNLNSWKKGKRKDVVASAVGLVEQQVPFFDALFFEWFVRRVLSQTRDLALEKGVDWGHDRSWCNAAKMYSVHVLHHRANASTHCAVLPRGTPIHHLDFKSMGTKRDNRAQFHANGVQVVQRYIDLFPTWVITDVLAPNNPLDSRNFHRYPKAHALNRRCVSSRSSGGNGGINGAVGSGDSGVNNGTGGGESTVI